MTEITATYIGTKDRTFTTGQQYRLKVNKLAVIREGCAPVIYPNVETFVKNWTGITIIRQK